MNEFPPLIVESRRREYDRYYVHTRSIVVYEFLFNARSSRWLDENILGLNSEKSKGYASFGVLKFIGLGAVHKGLFGGESINQVLRVLEGKDESFSLLKEHLKEYQDRGMSNIRERTEKDIQLEYPMLNEERTEGAQRYFIGQRYERNLANRLQAIAIHGISCSVCGFNFQEHYGSRGRGYIEVHHKKPLHTYDEAAPVNPATDLITVCSNCHRMIHREFDNLLTVEELKEIWDSHQ